MYFMVRRPHVESGVNRQPTPTQIVAWPTGAASAAQELPPWSQACN